MSYTLGQAAKATGKSKPTLSEAIKNGRLSAQKQPNGSYIIDPAELHRVYPPVSENGKNDTAAESSQTDNLDSNNRVLQSKVELLGELVRQISDERDDLRRRLDQESEERRRLTLMITHQPEAINQNHAQPIKAPAAPMVRPAVWVVLTLAAIAAAVWWIWFK